MIRLEAVAKRFGEVQALEPLDLEIGSGERLGIFGRNGSGKTSLLRLLVGISKPSSGRIWLEGKEASPEGWRRFRSGLGYMPERIQLFETSTGEHMLRYFARLKGVDTREVPPLLDQVGLGEAAKRKLGGYSKGMLQRLNLAQALLGEPRVLVVDEPVEGLDSHGVREFFEMVGSVENRTVIFSSHRLSLVSRFVKRLCVLSRGRVKALGTEAELHEKLDLPVHVVVRPKAETNGHLAESLSRLGPLTVDSRNDQIVARVSQKEKMRFLAGLHALTPSIRDVRIEEPSLEELLLETT